MKTSLLTSITLAFSAAMAAPYPTFNEANGGLARAENEEATKRNGDSLAMANGPAMADGPAMANAGNVPRVVNVRETSATKRGENMADMASEPGKPYIVDIPDTSADKKGENVADVANAADVPSVANIPGAPASKRGEKVADMADVAMKDASGLGTEREEHGPIP
ncbi:uncharacterized protein LDX57_007054 [Aspergillus melleus]|uniref:uncharacterized protein n=1 Tax=Aspergillus melleus TaxID=138277 RepID=UPI001E8DB633|nr:uncharacterized protein LDX57_007054 [Aspergillus melleus]KAH8429390.1 hypothetical protein LDX57_007054 [Aspergillus melleus]